ncbi:MAG: substrate-binding domain-containing protein [Cyanobacteria bacterium P01_F01_bin.53]
MVNRKIASALTVAALLACAIPAKSKASLLAPVVGQAVTPSFSVPDSVAKGTKVRVSSSSDNMNAITEALGSGFESQYANSEVAITTKDANAALQDVLNDNADLAAISRPLTEAEKAKGLVAIPVRREKIAIVVGKDNPFAQSITGAQFAQIFRGEISDWSAVGGTAGPIRLIDRPDASETRQALQPYPVFTTAEFKTGGNATQLGEDSTAALAKELGKDGIGYALVGQLSEHSDIKAIQLHKTLPDDPRYPFSQPYAFVYNGGASPAATAFLGYATGNPGQAALEGANLSGYSILPNGVTGTTSANAGSTAGTGDSGTADAAKAGSDAGADGAAKTTADAATDNANADGNNTDSKPSAAGTGNLDANGNLIDADGNIIAGADANGTANAGGNVGIDGSTDTGNLTAGRGRWWWLLLPLAGLGLLLWAAGKRGTEEDTGYLASTDANDDDRIRNNTFRSGDIPDGNVDTGNIGAAVGAAGKGINSGVSRTVAGGAALAGGAAAAGAGLAGRMKNKTGDITMDLDGIKGNVAGGIDGVKGSAKGVKGNVAGGIDNVKGGVKGSVQGGIDGIKGSAQGGLGGLRSNVRGGLNNVKSNVQGGIDGIKKPTIQGNDPDSWLDRAKQRINAATEQIKDSAADIKDDITKD